MMEELNKQFSKWLIYICIAHKSYVAVWGYDSNAGIDENDTKFIVDENEKIVLFDSKRSLYEAISEKIVPLFDEEKTYEWAKESQLITEIDSTNLSVFDLDSLADLIMTTDLGSPREVDSETAKYLVDFINLVTDFAEQISHKELMNIWENSPIHSLWEFMCDTYLWSIPAKELTERQQKLLSGYNGELCRQALQRMLVLFKSHLRVY